MTAGLTLSAYATHCHGVHITNPDAAGQARDAGRAGRCRARGGADRPHQRARHRDAGWRRGRRMSIAQVFGAGGVPVTSTKAIHGHLPGAGSAVERVAALRTLAARRLPPTANVGPVHAAIAIDLVRGEARTAPGLRHVMSNSFPFGGTNAVLVASALE